MEAKLILHHNSSGKQNKSNRVSFCIYFKFDRQAADDIFIWIVL